MLSKVCLTNYKFDNSYSDTYADLNFTDRSKYFNFSALFNSAVEVNFKIGNGLNTTITYRSPNPNLLKDLNYNYAIVGTSPTDANMRYYFINNISYDVEGQYILELELDVMMTYYDKNMLKCSSFNRMPMKSILDNSFNASKQTPIVSSGNYPKYVEDRITLYFTHYRNRTEMCNNAERWLNESVSCFEVYYCKPNRYRVNPLAGVFTSDEFKTISEGVTIVTQPFSVFVVPVLLPYKRFFIRHNNDLGDVRYMKDWIEQQITSANIYAKVVTKFFPINLSDTNEIESISIDAGGDMLTIKLNDAVTEPEFFYISQLKDKKYMAGAIGMPRNDIDYDTEYYYPIPDAFRFDKIPNDASILTTSGNLQINYDCVELALTDGANEMRYKPIYLNNTIKKGDKPYKIEAKIIVTPTSVKTTAWICPALFLSAGSDAMYSNYFSSLGNGFNSSATNQISIAQEQIDIYMANNKNYIGLMATNIAGRTFSTNHTIGTNVGITPSGVSAKAGIGKSLSIDLLGGALSLANNFMQLDNIKASPDDIILSTSSPEYNLGVLGGDLYLELRKSPVNVVRRILDDTVYNGYYVSEYSPSGYPMSMNLDGLPYAAVQANIGYVEAPIPNFVKNKIKQVFHNGVRIWQKNR